MNSTIINHSFRFVFLIFIQILFLNNVNINGFANVHLYLLFVLLLPYTINKNITLLLALAIGFVQDLFMGTMGLSMSSAVLIAYIKPFLIQIITDKKLDEGFDLTIQEQGFRWFVIFLTFSYFIYYLAYFTIEIGTFLNIFYIFIKSIFSTILSVFISFLLIYTFYSKSGRKY